MTTEEALRKAGISRVKWRRILEIAAGNKAMKSNGSAYVGGMKDFLWAMAREDHAIYDPLETELSQIPPRKPEGKKRRQRQIDSCPQDDGAGCPTEGGRDLLGD